jgi:hypothetical protein
MLLERQHEYGKRKKPDAGGHEERGEAGGNDIPAVEKFSFIFSHVNASLVFGPE